MQKIFQLHSPEFKDDRYFCVGDMNFIVLDDRYDPDQLWLNFDNETLLFRALTPIPVAKLTKEQLTPKRINRKLIPTPDSLQPYIVEEGVHQYPLPIDKWQMPSKSMASRIKDKNWPCFDRKENDELYEYKYNGVGLPLRTNENLRDWITKNCVGRVVLCGTRVVFEKSDDAMVGLISGNFSKF